MALCTGHTKAGKPCGAHAVHGTTVCVKHGAAAPQVKRAATRNLTIARAQRMVELSGVDMDPIQHLLDSLHRAATLVNVWGVMLATLDGSAEDERGNPHRDPLLTVSKLGVTQAHPFVVQYEQALERRAKFAKMCLDAGVSERQIALAERLGEQLATVFERTVAAISGLSSEQRLQAAEAYGREIALLERPAIDGTARDAA